jgi:hypothetical protein
MFRLGSRTLLVLRAAPARPLRAVSLLAAASSIRCSQVTAAAWSVSGAVVSPFNVAARWASEDATAAADAASHTATGGRPGDWQCPQCGVNNFASRNRCFKCVEPNPKRSGSDAAPREEEDKTAFVKRPGDWDCGSCSTHNFARRRKCMSCGAARPRHDGAEPSDATDATTRRPAERMRGD